MGKLKKPKIPKQPKAPFKEKLPKEERPSRAVRKAEKKFIKEELKRKKALEKKINRTISAFAVLLCIISSVLDVLIQQRDKCRECTIEK